MAEAKKTAAKAAKKTITKATETKASPEKVIKDAELVVETAPAAEQPETAAVPEVTEESEAVVVEEKATAKAGKRSAKALEEAAGKEAKASRKAAQSSEASTEGESKPKVAVKPARSRLERRAKGFRKSAEQLEVGKVYGEAEAVALTLKTSHIKFDATVELHVNLGVDPRQADQNIRDTVALPAGTGKTVRIAVLTEDAAAAKKAGADIAGTDDLLAQLEKGVIDFDILISTPTLMAKLGKYARTLGPKGLMPNPKSGTVTTDVNRAVAEAKAGRVEYRVDSTGIVHLGIGKVSFTPAQLQQNVEAVLASIKANKPSGVKGTYVKAIHLTTTMGPSIAVDLASAN